MHLACVDLETHLIAPLQVFPRLVLGATKCPAAGDPGTALGRDDVLDWVQQTIARTDIRLVNHAIGFDLGVVAAARPDLLPQIFNAYADNRVGCTHMLTQLADIAVYGTNKGGVVQVHGGRRFPCDQMWSTTETDDRSGRRAQKWWVKLPTSYSLEAQARRWLGVELLKDETRTTYADYDGIPVSELPTRQIEYVLADTCALELWLAVWAAADALGDGLPAALHDVYAQSRRDFALRLTEAAGRYVDPQQVAATRRRCRAVVQRHQRELLRAGLLEAETTAAPRYPYEKIEIKRSTKTAALVFGRLGLRPVKADAQRCELLQSYFKYKTPWLIPREHREMLFRLGCWRRDASSVRGEPEYTGRLTAKAAPAQELLTRCVDAGCPVLDRTPTGLYKLNGTNARVCGDPLVAKLVAYKKSNMMLADLDKYSAGVDTPLHVRVNGLAETGRTTSGGGMAGINDQNYRRDYGFRECFIARRGHAFASIDYSQIELCSLAQVQYEWFGRSALGDAINAGQDCHVVFAALLLGLAYPAAIELKKSGDKKLKEYRNLAKAFNFGRPGGLAEAKFVQWAKDAYGVTIPYSLWSVDPIAGYVEIPAEHLPGSVWVHVLPPELQALARVACGNDGEPVVFTVPTDPTGWQRVDMRWVLQHTGRVFTQTGGYAHLNSQWLTAYPEMLGYHDRIKELLKATGGRITQIGSGRYRAGTHFTNAANSFFQGLTADGATAALFAVWRECLCARDSPLYGCRVVWFVHDELGLEAPLERLTEACARASELMCAEMSRLTPRVKIEAEPAACRRWTKGADAARRTADGRLVPEEDWRLATGYYTTQLAKLRTAAKAGDKKSAEAAVTLAQEYRDVRRFFRTYGLEVAQ